MTFIKKVEDFICEKCGEHTEGDGYTNHCPKCLYSKHVDNNPGDRQATCWGLMKPENIENNGGEYSIVHKCTQCNHVKKNKVNKKDDFEAVLQISKDRAGEEMGTI